MNDFDALYTELLNNWNKEEYVVETIKDLNMKCDFIIVEYQKKILKGILSHFREKYLIAFKCFQESNNIEENGYAMNMIGYYFENGYAPEQDINKAIMFYKSAIKKGNIFSMYNLACCLNNGIGVEKDKNEAFKLYKIASEKGNKKALINLLMCYKKMSFVDRYEFYKSLINFSENNNNIILETIIKHNEIEYLKFENLLMKEKIKEIESKINSFSSINFTIC